MKKYKYTILGLLLLIPFITMAVNITVPQAPGTGYILESTSKGNYNPTANNLTFLKLDQTTPQTVINGAPIFSGNIVTPKVIGGSTTTSDLTLQTTSGIGATGADMHFLVGNNGATEAMTILNSGNVGIGTTGPTGKLDIQGTTAMDLPTYSAEFLLNTGWTSTDWTGDFATGWTHTTGNTTVLSQSKVAVNATKYQIAYTVTNRTAGSFTIGFGGQTNASITATGAWGPTTSSTANLTITPTTDFNGTIVISIKSITAVSTSLVNLKSSDGTARIEMRANTATGNTFIGVGSGRYNTTGNSNTANGYASLYSNTTGANNIANGMYSLYSNTSGNSNTANGMYSLYSNTSGNNNTANGYASLNSNTTGTNNIANGYVSLYFNTSGNNNTANGYASLNSNTTGANNIANGYASLYSNTTGANNIANGMYSLYSNTTGAYNTALGHVAGRYIADGTTGRTTGNNGLYIGYNSKASADGTDNEIVIGYNAIGLGSNTAVYGNTSMTKHIFSNGNVGIGTTSPTAVLHLKAGTATASTAPLKFTSGTLNTTAEDGTIEFLSNQFYMRNSVVYSKGTYAEIHNHDSSTAQNIATGTTYTKLTNYTDNGLSNNCTADATNDKITITKTGKYRIDGSFNFSDDTNNVVWRIAPFLGDAEQDSIHVKRKISTAGDSGSASFTGFISVTSVPVDLDIRARHDYGSTVGLVMEYSNLNVQYIGE